jgi:two-component system phosphate regulon sensor histidine kinase PhoR
LHDDRPEIVGAIQRGWGSSERYSSTIGKRLFYVAMRIERDSDVGFARVAVPVSELAKAERAYLGPLIGLLVGSFLVLIVPIYLVVRRWSRPLEELIFSGERLAAGELDVAIPLGQTGELGALSSSMDRTRRALQRKIAEIEGQYQVLDLVVGGMKEALLLVDGDSRVKLVNDAFRQVFSPNVEPQGRRIDEAIRTPEIIKVIESVLESREDRRQRIGKLGSGNQVFEVVVTPVRVEEESERWGAVALFLDVTRIETLEKTRREFVANVSHELRTPLTSIKASAITLSDGAMEEPELAERFLSTIVRQADRMSALVADLSDLSRIETGAIELEIRDVEVPALVRDVITQVSTRHEGRGIRVLMDFGGTFTIKADRERLEQVLVNLVDNAMKFNHAGGTVTIRGSYSSEGRPVIEVEDTGDGIALEHQEKVFQRFFRVDPSRSREMGGTGLGLAICKHLMNLHGGKLRLESELGEGSTFILEF